MYTYIHTRMGYIFFLSAICFFIAHFCGDLFSVFKHHTRTHRTKHILYTIIHAHPLHSARCIYMVFLWQLQQPFCFLFRSRFFLTISHSSEHPPSLSFVLIFVLFLLLFFFPFLFCSFFSLSFFYCVCRACFVVYSITSTPGTLLAFQLF